MSNPEVNEIIVNLNVLSKLEKNRKLITKQQYLNIDTSKTRITEAFSRWWREEGRDDALKKIDWLIMKSEQYLKSNPEIEDYLKNAISGLENLKQTYSNCTQTQARLDVIIDKINKITQNTLESIEINT
tara:strand:- start:3068 stop:3454 length:387 start_codon:yes stop_codon:yes gene_type:complete